MTELSKIYSRRFKEDIEFRKQMYRVLCDHFFNQYIPNDAVVLDIAAGYCEFINHIKAKRKIAIDLNPDLKKMADKDVETICSRSTDLSAIEDETIDVVFVSNLFEHITRKEIVKTLKEIHRILKNKGQILILQPNFRYIYKDYWMFFDHITPIDDRALSEVLEINRFKVLVNKPKFLPYSTKSRLPKSLSLLKIYLKLPILQSIFGQQAFICASKTSDMNA